VASQRVPGPLAVCGACGRGDLLDIDPEDFGEPGQDGVAVDAAPAPFYLGQPGLRPADQPASTA
jgi:hypothetical protein